MLANLSVFAQYTPKGMSYQAVARDDKGYELKNKELEVKISIIAMDPNGSAEYSETHTITTDKFGLFALTIGQGSFSQGTVSDFSEINWGSGVHYLKLEVDFGFGWRGMGTTQFLAVPYALYAGTAANAPEAKDEQQLSYNPEKRELSLDNSPAVDLSGLYNDADSDPTNELQFLDWNGEKLSIKNSTGYISSVILSNLKEDDDHDSINEIQDLHLEGNRLSITRNNASIPISLEKYLDNTDKQTLSSNGDSMLAISGGNSIPMDISKTNELQSPVLNGDDLSLTNDPTYRKVDLKKYLDNTDEQLLTSLGDTALNISGGNSIPMDISKTNELQSPVLSGNDLSLTKDLSSVKVNLEKYLDNTDKQVLSSSGYNLSIENGNTVNIRPKIIAFRAITRDYLGLVLPVGQHFLVFETEKLDSVSVYNNSTGEFIVPAGGDGLYQFNLVYQYGPTQTLEIWVNDNFYEQVFTLGTFCNYPFLLNLSAGNSVRIKLITSQTFLQQNGMFSGYRVH